MVIAWILIIIGTITTSLRFYVKLGASRSIGWDDYTAAAALVRSSSCFPGLPNMISRSSAS